MKGPNESKISSPGQEKQSDPFSSEVVDRIRAGGGVWNLPSGQIILPKVFGFCGGVRRALKMLQRAINEQPKDRKFFLLGEIIHNPWVNDYFRHRGVRILTRDDRGRLENLIRPDDVAVIPAFGVSPDIHRSLARIGCEVIDTTCGNVRRLWAWAEQAAQRGFAVLIFGRARHDETVVTRSRLAEAGGTYLVVGDMDQARRFCEMIIERTPRRKFAERFGAENTNAGGVEDFEALAQVSQTTMLFEDTIKVRSMLQAAFGRRYERGVGERLIFEPTVCRATQHRQDAAKRLCRRRPDLAIVVGGFGSSNTRHLYELTRRSARAYFIESPQAIVGPDELYGIGPAGGRPRIHKNFLGRSRPLGIAVLAGASTPEVIIGQVARRLAEII